MSKTKTKPRKRKPRSAEAPPPPLPDSVEVMLGPAEAAAALGMKPIWFNQQVKRGKVPGPDGKTPWGNRNFWKKSTINKFIESLSGQGSGEKGGGVDG